jgi:hypothetical protein
MWGAGLYGGVVRDLNDPSEKIISGEELNSIKPFFCAPPLLIVCAVAAADHFSYCSQANCLRLRQKGRSLRFWRFRGKSLTNVCERTLYKRPVVSVCGVLCQLLFWPHGPSGPFISSVFCLE